MTLPRLLSSSPVFVRTLTSTSIAWGKLAMCPEVVGKSDMEIADARIEHQELISKLMTGPGDSEGAMHRAELLFGLPYWCQWNLRHKKRATVSFMRRVHQAYLDAMMQAVRREVQILKAAEARGIADVDDRILLVEAENLVAKIEARKARLAMASEKKS